MLRTSKIRDRLSMFAHGLPTLANGEDASSKHPGQTESRLGSLSDGFRRSDSPNGAASAEGAWSTRPQRGGRRMRQGSSPGVFGVTLRSTGGPQDPSHGQPVRGAADRLRRGTHSIVRPGLGFSLDEGTRHPGPPCATRVEPGRSRPGDRDRSGHSLALGTGGVAAPPVGVAALNSARARRRTEEFRQLRRGSSRADPQARPDAA